MNLILALLALYIFSGFKLLSIPWAEADGTTGLYYPNRTTDPTNTSIGQGWRYYGCWDLSFDNTIWLDNGNGVENTLYMHHVAEIGQHKPHPPMNASRALGPSYYANSPFWKQRHIDLQSSLNPANCTTACCQHGYKFAALVNNTECRCSNMTPNIPVPFPTNSSLDPLDIINNSCHVPGNGCLGDPSQYCGYSIPNRPSSDAVHLSPTVPGLYPLYADVYVHNSFVFNSTMNSTRNNYGYFGCYNYSTFPNWYSTFQFPDQTTNILNAGAVDVLLYEVGNAVYYPSTQLPITEVNPSNSIFDCLAVCGGYGYAFGMTTYQSVYDCNCGAEIIGAPQIADVHCNIHCKTGLQAAVSPDYCNSTTGGYGCCSDASEQFVPVSYFGPVFYGDPLIWEFVYNQTRAVYLNPDLLGSCLGDIPGPFLGYGSDGSMKFGPYVTPSLPNGSRLPNVSTISLHTTTTAYYPGPALVTTNPPSIPTSIPNYPKYPFLGCYNESGVGNQIISGYFYIDNTQLTVHKCLKYCTLRGTNYAALIYTQGQNTQCQCGNQFTPGNLGRTLWENCRSLCPGNTPPQVYQICGGAQSYEAIYGLNATVSSTTSSSSQIPAATGVPTIYPGNGVYVHIGCFSDRLGAPYVLTGSISNQPTVEACLSWCQYGGYNFAGVKTMPFSNGAAPIASGGTDYSGTTCVCGNTIRNSQSVTSASIQTSATSSAVGIGTYGISSSGCTSPCIGNPNEICGGYSGTANSPQAAFVNLYSVQTVSSTSLTLTSSSSGSSTSSSATVSTTLAITSTSAGTSSSSITSTQPSSFSPTSSLSSSFISSSATVSTILAITSIFTSSTSTSLSSIASIQLLSSSLTLSLSSSFMSSGAMVSTTLAITSTSASSTGTSSSSIASKQPPPSIPTSSSTLSSTSSGVSTSPTSSSTSGLPSSSTLSLPPSGGTTSVSSSTTIPLTSSSGRGILTSGISSSSTVGSPLTSRSSPQISPSITPTPIPTPSNACGVQYSLTCSGNSCCGQSNTCGINQSDCQVVAGSTATYAGASGVATATGGSGGISSDGSAVNSAGAPVQPGQAGCQPQYGCCGAQCYGGISTTPSSTLSPTPSSTLSPTPSATPSGACGIPYSNLACSGSSCCAQANTCGVAPTDCQVVAGSTYTNSAGATVTGGSGGVDSNGNAINSAGAPVQSGQAGCQTKFGCCGATCYGGVPSTTATPTPSPTPTGVCGIPYGNLACAGSSCCGQANTCGIAPTDCSVVPGSTYTNSAGATVTGGSGGIGSSGNAINSAGSPVQSGQAGCQPLYGCCGDSCYTTIPSTSASATPSVSGVCGPFYSASCSSSTCCAQANTCGLAPSDCQTSPGVQVTNSAGSTITGGAGGTGSDGGAINTAGIPVQSGQGGCQPQYGCCGSSCYGVTSSTLSTLVSTSSSSTAASPAQTTRSAENIPSSDSSSAIVVSFSNSSYTPVTTLPTTTGVSASDQCGSVVGVTCGAGLCCGQSNTCGFANSDCEIVPAVTQTGSGSGTTGCQPQYGVCYQVTSSTQSSSTALTTDPAGFCGPGIGSCGNGLCCGQGDVCGSGAGSCIVTVNRFGIRVGGCQTQYGTCGGSITATVPITSAPSSTIGSVVTITSSISITATGSCGAGVGACQPGLCCGPLNTCGVGSSNCAIIPAPTSSETGSSEGQLGCQTAYGYCYAPSTTSSSVTASISSTCGAGIGSCSNGLCCGSNGVCGVGDSNCYTNSGCQTQFGYCYGVTRTLTMSMNYSTTTLTAVSPTASGACGFGIAPCSNGLCCGGSSTCGVGDSNCAAASGCQTQYGYCFGAASTTSPSTTYFNTNVSPTSSSSSTQALTSSIPEYYSFAGDYDAGSTGGTGQGISPYIRFTKYWEASDQIDIESCTMWCAAGAPQHMPPYNSFGPFQYAALETHSDNTTWCLCSNDMPDYTQEVPDSFANQLASACPHNNNEACGGYDSGGAVLPNGVFTGPDIAQLYVLQPSASWPGGAAPSAGTGPLAVGSSCNGMNSGSGCILCGGNCGPGSNGGPGGSITGTAATGQPTGNADTSFLGVYGALGASSTSIMSISPSPSTSATVNGSFTLSPGSSTGSTSISTSTATSTSTLSTSSSTSTVLAYYASIGCYDSGSDGSSYEAGTEVWQNSSQIDADTCTTYCLYGAPEHGPPYSTSANSPFNFAALETHWDGSVWCFCFNNRPDYVGPAASQFCDSPCVDDPNETCGGYHLPISGLGSAGSGSGNAAGSGTEDTCTGPGATCSAKGDSTLYSPDSQGPNYGNVFALNDPSLWPSNPPPVGGAGISGNGGLGLNGGTGGTGEGSGGNISGSPTITGYMTQAGGTASVTTSPYPVFTGTFGTLSSQKTQPTTSGSAAASSSPSAQTSATNTQGQGSTNEPTVSGSNSTPISTQAPPAGTQSQQSGSSVGTQNSFTGIQGQTPTSPTGSSTQGSSTDTQSQESPSAVTQSSSTIVEGQGSSTTAESGSQSSSTGSQGQPPTNLTGSGTQSLSTGTQIQESPGSTTQNPPTGIQSQSSATSAATQTPSTESQDQGSASSTESGNQTAQSQESPGSTTQSPPSDIQPQSSATSAASQTPSTESQSQESTTSTESGTLSSSIGTQVQESTSPTSPGTESSGNVIQSQPSNTSVGVSASGSQISVTTPAGSSSTGGSINPPTSTPSTGSGTQSSDVVPTGGSNTGIATTSANTGSQSAGAQSQTSTSPTSTGTENVNQSQPSATSAGIESSTGSLESQTSISPVDTGTGTSTYGNSSYLASITLPINGSTLSSGGTSSPTSINTDSIPTDSESQSSTTGQIIGSNTGGISTSPETATSAESSTTGTGTQSSTVSPAGGSSTGASGTGSATSTNSESLPTGTSSTSSGTRTSNTLPTNSGNTGSTTSADTQSLPTGTFSTGSETQVSNTGNNTGSTTSANTGTLPTGTSSTSSETQVSNTAETSSSNIGSTTSANTETPPTGTSSTGNESQASNTAQTSGKTGSATSANTESIPTGTSSTGNESQLSITGPTSGSITGSASEGTSIPSNTESATTGTQTQVSSTAPTTVPSAVTFALGVMSNSSNAGDSVAGSVKKRQESNLPYIASNSVTSNCLEATQYSLYLGQLSVGGTVQTGGGRLISTDPNVLSQPFVPSNYVGSIADGFSLNTDGPGGGYFVNWFSIYFTNNMAVFCQMPDSSIQVVFRGVKNLPTGCSAVSLMAIPPCTTSNTSGTSGNTGPQQTGSGDTGSGTGPNGSGTGTSGSGSGPGGNGGTSDTSPNPSAFPKLPPNYFDRPQSGQQCIAVEFVRSRGATTFLNAPTGMALPSMGMM